MTKVAVIGAGGRMGTAICEAAEHDDGLELVARLGSADDLAEVAGSGATVAVDVTNAGAAKVNLPRLAADGIDAVVGTTGFTPDDVASLHQAFVAAGRRCFLVPNFSVGAVLVMRFAEMAAPHFDGVEIIELHHNKKKDAPSGTARLTAEKIAAARTTPWAPDATEQAINGARGADVDGVAVHSVRLNGLLAHEEVIFGIAGQTLTLRHDSFDRQSFMPGVLLAVKSLDRLSPGVTTGLEAVLDL